MIYKEFETGINCQAIPCNMEIISVIKDKIQVIGERWKEVVRQAIQSWEMHANQQLKLICSHPYLNACAYNLQTESLLRRIEGMDSNFVQGIKNIQHLYLSFKVKESSKNDGNISKNSLSKHRSLSTGTNQKTKSKSKRIEYFADAKKCKNQSSNLNLNVTMTLGTASINNSSSHGFNNKLFNTQAFSKTGSNLNKTLKKPDLSSTFSSMHKENHFQQILERSKAKAQQKFAIKDQILLNEFISPKNRKEDERQKLLQKKVDELQIKITHKIDEFIESFKKRQLNKQADQAKDSNQKIKKEIDLRQNSPNVSQSPKAYLNDQSSLLKSSQSLSSARKCGVMNGKAIKSKAKTNIVKNITENDEQCEQSELRHVNFNETKSNNGTSIKKMTTKIEESYHSAKNLELQQRIKELHQFIEIGEKVKLPITKQFISLFKNKLIQDHTKQGCPIPSSLANIEGSQTQNQLSNLQQNQFLQQSLSKMNKLLQLKCGEQKKASITKYVLACLRCIRGGWAEKITKQLTNEDQIKQQIIDLIQIISK